jgi:hypothetical protein
MVRRSVLYLCLILLVSCAELAAQRSSGGGQMCQSVRSLLEESNSDFNSIKRNVTHHSDGATDWVPSIVVAGSQDCEGQSDPEIASSVSCTMAESPGDLAGAYQDMVSDIRSCLSRDFVYSERQGGKSTHRSTPIKEATFEIKGKGSAPDGPAVRITLAQIHTSRRSGYELTIWVDARDRE